MKDNLGALAGNEKAIAGGSLLSDVVDVLDGGIGFSSGEASGTELGKNGELEGEGGGGLANGVVEDDVCVPFGPLSLWPVSKDDVSLPVDAAAAVVVVVEEGESVQLKPVCPVPVAEVSGPLCTDAHFAAPELFMPPLLCIPKSKWFESPLTCGVVKELDELGTADT